MEIKLKEKTNNLFITEREYFPLIFKFKNEHPDYDIKVISKDELVGKLSFTYYDDPVPTFIENNHEYTKARKYKTLLPVVDVTKHPELNRLYKILKEQDNLQYDPYGVLELSHKHIYLLECEEDEEIKNLLNINNLSYELLSFTDLGINPINPIEDEIFTITEFDNKFDQYMMIFSDIRRIILKDSSYKDKLKILINDDSDIFYVNLCSSLFNIPVSMDTSKPLIANADIKHKMDVIHKEKDFIIKDEELNNPSLKTLDDVIQTYHLDKLESFEYAYANLLEILSSNCVKEEKEDKGIIVTRLFNIDTDAYIYITNFQFNAFYKEYADNNVLNDAELKALHANTSYIKTSLDRRKKLNYLKYSHILLCSRVKQHLSDSIYDSQFAQEFFMTKVHQKYHLDGCYTTSAKNVLTTKINDDNYIRTNGYDHRYKTIKVNEEYKKRFIRDKWSVTNLEGFLNCPFKYYLSNIIPSDDMELHTASKGTLIHAVFEDIYHDDFDFETSFQKGLKAYQNNAIRKGVTLTKKEETWIEIIKSWLEKFVKTYLSINKEYLKIVPNNHDYEKKVTFNLVDENGKTYAFTGFIDKVLWTKYNDREFYTILDYKTGNEEFTAKEVCIGKSIQLPLYYYALSQPNQEDITNGYEFGGFGIQHVYFRTPKKAIYDSGKGLTSEDTLITNSRLSGISKNDFDYWHSVDHFGLKDKDDGFKQHGGKVIARSSTFNEPDGDETINSKLTEYKYNLNDLVEDAKKSAIRIIHQIENADFKITPTTNKLTNYNTTYIACGYCPYHDVCYRSIALDAKDYRLEMNKRFDALKKIESEK